MTATATTGLAAPSSWPPLRALAADRSQRIFRACLTVLSRPGTLACLPEGSTPDPVPAVVMPLLALTDLMAPLAGLGPDTEEAATLIGRVTGAKTVEPAAARFAFAFGESSAMAELSVGSHWSPEFGAMLCQRVTGLQDGNDDSLRLRLSGPGIREFADLTVSGLTTRFVEMRGELTANFPSGIDVLLVADNEVIAGLPRTTRIEVL